MARPSRWRPRPSPPCARRARWWRRCSAGEPVYGLTTGVGERKAFLLDPAERQRFNHRLVLNHRIAQGDAAPANVVRGAMLCLANSYAKGVTGVRPELAR